MRRILFVFVLCVFLMSSGGARAAEKMRRRMERGEGRRAEVSTLDKPPERPATVAAPSRLATMFARSQRAVGAGHVRDRIADRGAEPCLAIGRIRFRVDINDLKAFLRR